MSFHGINFSDGNPMIESHINPLMGYRIVHALTGRILPTTQRHEIFGFHKAIEVSEKIRKKYENSNNYIDLSEYELEPIYLSEIENKYEKGFTILYSDKDIDEMDLFKE